MAFTPLHANNLTAVCYKRRLNVAKGRITHIAISRALQCCTCGVSSLAYTLGGDVQRYTRAEMARRLEVYGRMVCKGADEDPFDPEDLAPEAADDGL
jgi:hypothetical protein